MNLISTGGLVRLALVRAAQGRQLPVGLDQPRHHRHRVGRSLLAVRPAGELVEVVPDPRQLAQEVGIDAARLVAAAHGPHAVETLAHQLGQRDAPRLGRRVPAGALFLRRPDLDPHLALLRPSPPGPGPPGPPPPEGWAVQGGRPPAGRFGGDRRGGLTSPRQLPRGHMQCGHEGMLA